MNKIFFSISLAIIVFFSSYISSEDSKIKIGDKTPELIFSSQTEDSLEVKLKDKYLLINFWSKNDPVSRLRNHQLMYELNVKHDYKIQMVSICVDKEGRITDEIIKIDKLQERIINIYSSELNPEILNYYKTETGLRSYLLSPDGFLLSISPDLKSLNELIPTKLI